MASCRVLAQKLGVLLGDPVDDQRDDYRDHQPASRQILTGGDDDGGGDDRAVDSGRAAAATVSILGRLGLTHDVCLRGWLGAPGCTAFSPASFLPMLANRPRAHLHPAGMNSAGGNQRLVPEQQRRRAATRCG